MEVDGRTEIYARVIAVLSQSSHPGADVRSYTGRLRAIAAPGSEAGCPVFNELRRQLWQRKAVLVLTGHLPGADEVNELRIGERYALCVEKNGCGAVCQVRAPRRGWLPLRGLVQPHGKLR